MKADRWIIEADAEGGLVMAVMSEGAVIGEYVTDQVTVEGSRVSFRSGGMTLTLDTTVEFVAIPE